MKAIHRIITAAALSFVHPAPASAAVGGQEVIIYRFPGVLDQGGADFTGVVTIFNCTNFSGVTETIRFVTRNADATVLISNVTVSIPHLATRTAATRGPFSYGAHILLAQNGVVGGTTAIAATSTNIICTPMVSDASGPVPVGVALRGIRFSPVPGSQE
jgi:hypothetical protein